MNDKKSPYCEFIQENQQIEQYLAHDWLIAKSPIAYRILKFLAKNMDNYNAVICSYQILQDSFKISKASVTRAIKLLKDKRYIEVYKSGSSNVYSINKRLFWKSWGKNYRFAKFGANVILSLEEQEICVQTKFKKEKQIQLKEKEIQLKARKKKYELVKIDDLEQNTEAKQRDND